MFAKKLKNLREEKKLTQKEVADAVGISDRVYGYYEMGDRFPKEPEVLKKLADLFEVSVDYLLGRAPRNVSPSNPQNPNIEKFLLEAERYLRFQDGLMFNGEPVTEDAIETIIDAMRFGMEQARKRSIRNAPNEPLQRSVEDDQKDSTKADSRTSNQ